MVRGEEEEGRGGGEERERRGGGSPIMNKTLYYTTSFVIDLIGQKVWVI